MVLRYSFYYFWNNFIFPNACDCNAVLAVLCILSSRYIKNARGTAFWRGGGEKRKKIIIVTHRSILMNTLIIDPLLCFPLIGIKNLYKPAVQYITSHYNICSKINAYLSYLCQNSFISTITWTVKPWHPVNNIQCICILFKYFLLWNEGLLLTPSYLQCFIYLHISSIRTVIEGLPVATNYTALYAY